jgi:quinol monooxygenase YgiN/mannose-6-phosphate isomerase-like protein (cupin superfamily)
MTKIARYARAQAQPGKGDALADLLLRVADQLRDAPGCELYLVNRAADDPDTIWVTEQWSDQGAMQAALDAARASEEGPRPEEALALVVPGQWHMTELQPLGGLGVPQAPEGYARVNLEEVEDLAAAFGFGEIGSARFANDALGVGPTGLSLQRLNPGRRQAFGHRHQRVEEVYVVLAGSGRLQIGDDTIEVGPKDAVRVGPRLARCFEAGDAGLEFVAFGQRQKGDGEMLTGWWGG